MSLDELDRVARERLIGSPPHSFQKLGTMERLKYVERIGTMGHLGTIGKLGTVLLAVHIGTLHKVDRIGTLDEMTRAGTLNRIVGGRVGSLGRLGTVHYQERLGTLPKLGSVGRLGSVSYVQRIGTVEHIGTQRYLGSVNRLAGGRVGTLGRLGTVKYVERVGTAHTGTVPIDSQTRLYNPRVFLTGSRIGKGSTWVGSWTATDIYRVKTSAFNLSRGGSIILIAGMAGTKQADVTGTYYGPVRIGGGSFNTFSFTEAMQYFRPIVIGGGTARVVLGRQV